MSNKYTKLPDTLYSVRVPLIYTYTEEEMAVLGIPILEDTAGKKTVIEDQMTNVMLPLTRIIDIYGLGAPIRLTNPDQLTEIYEILDDYVNPKASQQQVLNAPVYDEKRDLIIDQFAAEMFNINRRQIVTEETSTTGFDLGFSKMELNSKFAQDLSHAHGYLFNSNKPADPDKVVRRDRVRRKRTLNVGGM